jgi:hypothetical protein
MIQYPSALPREDAGPIPIPDDGRMRAIMPLVRCREIRVHRSFPRCTNCRCAIFSASPTTLMNVRRSRTGMCGKAGTPMSAQL